MRYAYQAAGLSTESSTDYQGSSACDYVQVAIAIHVRKRHIGHYIAVAELHWRRSGAESAVAIAKRNCGQSNIVDSHNICAAIMVEITRGGSRVKLKIWTGEQNLGQMFESAVAHALVHDNSRREWAKISHHKVGQPIAIKIVHGDLECCPRLFELDVRRGSDWS